MPRRYLLTPPNPAMDRSNASRVNGIPRRSLLIGGLALLAILAFVFALRGAWERSHRKAACPEGTVPRDDRCCAEGQTNRHGACVGRPDRCPPGFERTEDACVVRPSRIRIEPGRLLLGPGDWEAQGVVAPRDVVLDHAIWLDAYEVTVHLWQRCVADRACPASQDREPGRPVRSVTFDQARAYCRWSGGDLPSDDAWLVAASGSEARRYPWGNTGAVCRRADWGRFAGPCVTGASGPQWAGLMRDDATPEGVVGLAGGVAEWVLASGGRAAARGGSWKSRLATELRTWRVATHPPDHASADMGFRCAYERAASR